MADIDKHTVEKAYARWAPVYDLVFGAVFERGPRRVFERGFAPAARRLGWRPEFPWARLATWAARHGGVELLERLPMPPLGHFSLIRYARRA